MKRGSTMGPLALLAACTMPQWVSLGHKNSGKVRVEEFVDVSSIRVVGDIRRAEWMMLYPAHATKGEGAYAGKWVSNYDFHSTYNCNRYNSKFESSKIYYEDGTSSQMPSGSKLKEWEPVLPDTTNEAAMKFVCSRKSK